MRKTTEPVVLPAGFPNLLVNGAQGIAVGMATNIPPSQPARDHRRLCMALIDERRDRSLDELMHHRAGAGFSYRRGDLRTRRHSPGLRNRSRHRSKMRARVRGRRPPERWPSDRDQRAPLPGQQSSSLIERIAELVGEKKVEGISDVRDESDRRGLRIVIELRRDAVPQVTLNQLWAQTALESSFSVNSLAIVNGQPTAVYAARLSRGLRRTPP